MSIKEIISNDDGRLSTTNTIQVVSAFTLCIGFFIALFLDKSIASELGFTIAGMATLTATSKGIISAAKREPNKIDSQGE